MTVIPNMTDREVISVIDHAIKTKNIHHNDKDNTVHLFHDFYAGRDLAKLYELGKEIDHGFDAAFELQYDKTGKFQKAKPMKIARLLGELKNSDTRYHHRYVCHDYISTFLAAMERHRVNSFNWFDIKHAIHHEQFASAINGLVEEVRKRLRSHKVQERIRNRSKTAYRNFKSGTAYVNALFEIYARLCIVRVDLGYDWLEDGSMVSLEESRLDVRALLNCINKQDVFRHCVGHLGKLEFGYKKGYHYHMLFFFDGSKVINDNGIAEKIGKFWAEQITSGQGTYRNCNRKKHKEYGDKCAIGMVHHADLKMRDNLEYVIGYFTKSDQFVLAKPTSKTRTFYKGTLPKNINRNLGRPRQLRAG